jgi:hypothetical protein
MTWKAPSGRKRDVHFHLWATEEEAVLIKERMAVTGITSFGTFARKMLIDGYHVNIDLSGVREMVRLLGNATNNINQIARRANETRNIYAEDVEDVRRQFDTLWDAARKILEGLAKIK